MPQPLLDCDPRMPLLVEPHLVAVPEVTRNHPFEALDLRQFWLGRTPPARPAVATYLKDLLERVLTAGLGGFLGGIVITRPLDGSMWYAAGVGAAVSLVKGLAARLRGDRNSASLSRTV